MVKRGERRTEMAKIVISEEVSLDGVLQDPTGEEGFRHGGWFNQIGDETRQAWAELKTKEAFTTSALLLGRKTDEWFGTRWSNRSGEWADRLNSLPKYVVSSKLVDPVWSNSTVLKGDVVGEVTRLKRELDGELVVFASRPLVQSLLEHDLVDEVRLTVYPVVLGDGELLFGELCDQRPLRLLEARMLGDGLAQLYYERVRD
jgi:dihydrofolate reductase